MRKMKKFLALTACAAMLVAASVMGTLAYLTSQDEVTNTFTVGDVKIELDEADVNKDGTYVTDHDARVKGNEYHLLPGHTYFKDPTVTVLEDSEDVYVRMMVKVENLEALKTALPYSEVIIGEDGTTHQVINSQYYVLDEDDNATFLLQMLCADKDGNLTWDNNVWKYETFHTTGGYADSYEFRYVGPKSVNGIVKKSEDVTILEDLFTHITVPGEIDNDNLKHLADVEIVVTAHAIQADGFESAADAWDSFN